MKRFIGVLSTCFLLAGCGSPALVEETSSPPTHPVLEDQPRASFLLDSREPFRRPVPSSTVLKDFPGGPAVSKGLPPSPPLTPKEPGTPVPPAAPPLRVPPQATIDGGVPSVSLPPSSPPVSLFTDFTPNALETKMFDLVNALRFEVGAPAFSVHAGLATTARAHARTLPVRFEHNPFVATQIPAGWDSWGENIASAASIEEAFEDLVNSPTHYVNMVSSSFSHLGVGVVEENDIVYVVQVFAKY